MPRRCRKFWKWMNGLVKSVCVPGFGLLDGVQQAEELPLAGGGRDVVLDVFIEDDEAGRIALGVGHVAERGGDEAGVIELGDAGGAEAHGGGGVEEEEELGIGLALVAFEEAAVGAGEDVPIDVAEVVALGVGAILGEFLGEAEVRRAMESGDEAVDHGLGYQVEAGDGGERRGV